MFSSISKINEVLVPVPTLPSYSVGRENSLTDCVLDIYANSDVFKRLPCATTKHVLLPPACPSGRTDTGNVSSSSVSVK